MKTVKGIRILTEDQIQNLSANGFKAYRNKILNTRNFYPDESKTLTEDEIQAIRQLDYLTHAVGREYDRRREACAKRGEWRKPMARFQKWRE